MNDQPTTIIFRRLKAHDIQIPNSTVSVSIRQHEIFFSILQNEMSKSILYICLLQ